MDKLLYINTVPDIRIKEMVSTTGANSKLQKIIVHYLQGKEEKTIEVSELPYTNDTPLGECENTFIELVYPKFSIASEVFCVKQDNKYNYILSGQQQEIVSDRVRNIWLTCLELKSDNVLEGINFQEIINDPTVEHNILYKQFIYTYEIQQAEA